MQERNSPPSSLVRVKETFLAVMELPEAGRAAELDRRCADDPDLRAKVVRMLGQHALTTGFLAAGPRF